MPYVLDLYSEMKLNYGVGRRATDTGVQACIRMGLIEKNPKRIGKNPTPTLLHELTEKGKNVAELI
ncbi:MAG: hypothetical protein ACE5Z5_14025, partial [Candidatus Bathyarchaeia archaeon]